MGVMCWICCTVVTTPILTKNLRYLRKVSFLIIVTRSYLLLNYLEPGFSYMPVGSVYQSPKVPSEKSSKYLRGLISSVLSSAFRWVVLLLLEQSLCPDGMSIVGLWCYKTFTEAKETQDYVPQLVQFAFRTIFCCSFPRVLVYVPSITPLPCTFPLPLPPPPLPFPPFIFMPACSHHFIPTCAHGALSNPSHRYTSERVAMYCKTVFCRRQMYSSIVWNPASFLAAAVEV